MNVITLDSVVPCVFAGRDVSGSDVWGRVVTFEKGTNVLIDAASGAGKSSLCSYLLGYRNDYEGRICFSGNDVRQMGIARWAEIRKSELSCIYQELRLFPELTALENVELKNRLTGLKEAREIDAWFERLGIADKRDVRVSRMSFGQRQRVAAVRALVQPFDFLLADEPVSHLDDANAAVLADIMAEEAGRRGAGLIVTSVGRKLPLKYDRVLHL